MKTLRIANLSILLSAALFYSCTDNEPTVNNLMDIAINGKTYQAINETVGGNENCDILYINASFTDKNTIDFTINFHVAENGELLQVIYGEYTAPLNVSQIKKMFLTPNFNPTSGFTISNFSYNENTGAVKFNFNGTVLNTDDNTITRKISGSIDIKALPSVKCSVAKTGLTYSAKELNLFCVFPPRTKYSDLTQLHRFFSNNGYSIGMHLSGDLWNYPVGEIEFNEDDVLDRVEFKQLIGPLKASYIKMIRDEEWKAYETSGKIIIEEKYIEENEKVIKGRLQLTIKDNGQLIYSLDDVEFRTGSFEN